MLGWTVRAGPVVVEQLQAGAAVAGHRPGKQAAWQAFRRGSPDDLTVGCRPSDGAVEKLAEIEYPTLLDGCLYAPSAAARTTHLVAPLDRLPRGLHCSPDRRCCLACVRPCQKRDGSILCQFVALKRQSELPRGAAPMPRVVRLKQN